MQQATFLFFYLGFDIKKIGWDIQIEILEKIMIRTCQQDPPIEKPVSRAETSL